MSHEVLAEEALAVSPSSSSDSVMVSRSTTDKEKVTGTVKSTTEVVTSMTTVISAKESSVNTDDLKETISLDKHEAVEVTEPIHVNGPVETLDLPEFIGGVNPYDAPIYEKPELKVEEPAFKPIIGDRFPKKEVPVEVPNKVSDSEKDKPLSPREETPSIDGLETPKQVLTSNSSQKPQNAPDLISISQVEKVTPNYLTSPKQAHSGSEQVLPNTGGSESDKLASLSGIGLLGLLGLAGLRKSKED